MGVIKKSTFKMTEKNIIKSLLCDRRIVEKYPVMLPNCYTQPDNEADLFAVRKSGFCDEFEIKVTRQDFLADAKKWVQYREIDKQIDLFKGDEYEQWVTAGRIKGEEPWCMFKREALEKGLMQPNYFWYVLSEKVKVEDSEIPEWAGVIFISEKGWVRIARDPKRLHKGKIDANLYEKVLKKGLHRYLDKLRWG